MRSKVIHKCMNIIKTSSLNFNDEKLEQIEYGLEAIYILITKTAIIFLIAFILGIAKQLLIFLLIYNIIRMPSFGLHASSSIICLISSLLIFFTGVYISIYISIPLYIKVILGIYCIVRIYMNAPADTYKRPIINQKRRDIYKFISSVTAIIFTFLGILIQNVFMGNTFIIALFIQMLMVSPITYKVFRVPYDNYKLYNLNYGLNSI